MALRISWCKDDYYRCRFERAGAGGTIIMRARERAAMLSHAGRACYVAEREARYMRRSAAIRLSSSPERRPDITDALS